MPAVAKTQSAWNPMSSAPKDGRDILVYRPRESDEYPAHVGIDNWYIYGTGPGCWAHSRRDQQPTHWMALPDPPQTNK